MPTNARKTRWYSTGGPWGTALLVIGLGVTGIGVGYILSKPSELPPALAWIDGFVPIAGWGLLFTAAGLFSIVRALGPPQRPGDVMPALSVVGLWSGFYCAFWIYSGLWRGDWTRDWIVAVQWGSLAALLVCFSRTVNPPTGRR